MYLAVVIGTRFHGLAMVWCGQMDGTFVLFRDNSPTDKLAGEGLPGIPWLNQGFAFTSDWLWVGGSCQIERRPVGQVQIQWYGSCTCVISFGVKGCCTAFITYIYINSVSNHLGTYHHCMRHFMIFRDCILEIQSCESLVLIWLLWFKGLFGHEGSKIFIVGICLFWGVYLGWLPLSRKVVRMQARRVSIPRLSGQLLGVNQGRRLRYHGYDTPYGDNMLFMRDASRNGQKGGNKGEHDLYRLYSRRQHMVRTHCEPETLG